MNNGNLYHKIKQTKVENPVVHTYICKTKQVGYVGVRDRDGKDDLHSMFYSTEK